MQMMTKKGKGGNYRWQLIDGDGRVLALPPIQNAFSSRAEAMTDGMNLLYEIGSMYGRAKIEPTGSSNKMLLFSFLLGCAVAGLIILLV